jgi:hypothetical protein
MDQKLSHRQLHDLCVVIAHHSMPRGIVSVTEDIEMDVRIDEPGHDGIAVSIDNLGSSGDGEIALVPHGENLFSPNEHHGVGTRRTAETVDEEAADDGERWFLRDRQRRRAADDRLHESEQCQGPEAHGSTLPENARHTISNMRSRAGRSRAGRIPSARARGPQIPQIKRIDAPPPSAALCLSPPRYAQRVFARLERAVRC